MTMVLIEDKDKNVKEKSLSRPSSWSTGHGTVKTKRRLPEIPLVVGKETADKALSPMCSSQHMPVSQSVKNKLLEYTSSESHQTQHTVTSETSRESTEDHLEPRESSNTIVSTGAKITCNGSRKQSKSLVPDTILLNENKSSKENEEQTLLAKKINSVERPVNFIVRKGDLHGPSQSKLNDFKNIEANSEELLSSDMHQLQFNTTSQTTIAFLDSNNVLLTEDSSPDDKPPANASKMEKSLNWSPESPQVRDGCPCIDDLVATHRGVHKFVPRHSDEIAVEIGDPVYVEEEADDLWCQGVNLRTGMTGIFPSVYATDLDLLNELGTVSPCMKEYFDLYFLGSIEVNYHKGTDVLCQAIYKVILTRKMTLNAKPPSSCQLEINGHGIKMCAHLPTKSVKRTPSIKKKFGKIFKSKHKADNSHFFSLKNVSFCGYHPNDERYFAFITKHPLEMRFACHVLVGDESTKPVGLAVGRAFKQFYNEYMAFAHPTEDIYLE